MNISVNLFMNIYCFLLDYLIFSRFKQLTSNFTRILSFINFNEGAKLLLDVVAV